MTIPNIISLTRLLLTPVIGVFILRHQYVWAFWLCVFAGISDILDGLLARVLQHQSTLGRYLDPLADKVLLMCLYIALGWVGIIPSWLIIAVVFRDFLILGGALLTFIFNLRFDMRPLWMSKINTFFQIFLVAFVLLEAMMGAHWQAIRDLLFVITGFTTCLSGVLYVAKWTRTLNEKDAAGHL
jgi:cardiolipin synthase